MSILKQELLRGELWKALQEIKDLRAKLRKARRPGKVLARGYICTKNGADIIHEGSCTVAYLCSTPRDGTCLPGSYKCRRVEVREVKEAGR